MEMSENVNNVWSITRRGGMGVGGCKLCGNKSVFYAYSILYLSKSKQVV
jgi:hypothetical protein